jgi:hypothetical protein
MPRASASQGHEHRVRRQNEQAALRKRRMQSSIPHGVCSHEGHHAQITQANAGPQTRLLNEREEQSCNQRPYDAERRQHHQPLMNSGLAAPQHRQHHKSRERKDQAKAHIKSPASTFAPAAASQLRRMHIWGIRNGLRCGTCWCCLHRLLCLTLASGTDGGSWRSTSSTRPTTNSRPA